MKVKPRIIKNLDLQLQCNMLCFSDDLYEAVKWWIYEYEIKCSHKQNCCYYVNFQKCIYSIKDDFS